MEEEKTKKQKIHYAYLGLLRILSLTAAMLLYTYSIGSTGKDQRNYSDTGDCKFHLPSQDILSQIGQGNHQRDYEIIVEECGATASTVEDYVSGNIYDAYNYKGEIIENYSSYGCAGYRASLDKNRASIQNLDDRKVCETNTDYYSLYNR